MKKGTKNVLRVVISIVYIVWGLWSPISVLKAVLALDMGAIISAAVGVVTLLAGIFGLLGAKKSMCRTMGVIIFIGAIVAIVFALPTINVNAIVNAILAWLFIACI